MQLCGPEESPSVSCIHPATPTDALVLFCGCKDSGHHVMARPVIPPFTIRPTAPETFSVLEQRMRVAEEEAEALISELQALGVTSHRFTKSEVAESAEHIRPISPVRARPAFTGDDTLWRNCENLVTRMCQMESVLHTLKRNVFHLHTDRELCTKHSDELEHRLLQMQEEHVQEVKDAQLEVMRLRQRLNCAIEQRKREQEAKKRLSAALEIATTAKTEVVIAAEELKATKAYMSQSLGKVQDRLSQEVAMRALLEEEQAGLLLTVQGMKNVVEEERTRVQELQQYCQQMNRDGKEMKSKVESAELRCQEAEKDRQRLRSEMEAKDLCIRQLQEEVKIMKQKWEEEQDDLTQIQADFVVLWESEEKVQCLNQHLQNRCSELTERVQKVTNQKLQLVTQHQQEFKMAQDGMAKKLEEKEALLRIVQTNLGAEMQKTLNERTQLERELESLRAKHSMCKQEAVDTEKKNTVQMEMQENTIGSLRADLGRALQEKAALENEKKLLREEKAVLQQQLSEACEQTTKMSECLENVLSSKAKLQKDLEKLQTALGRRDNDLFILHQERTGSWKHIEKLKSELLQCSVRLQDTGCQQHGKVEPLQKFVDIAQEGNRRLAHALDLALQRNSTLQNHVNELETKVQKELQEKIKSGEDYRIKERLLKDKLVSLKKQQRVKSKESKSASGKEVTELKKALDSLTTKSTERSQTSRELRNGGSVFEKETLHQKDLICSLKTQLQSYIDSQGFRKQYERIQDFYNLKTSPSFPPSTLEHWKTKQKLQLISRNVLFNNKTTQSNEETVL